MEGFLFSTPMLISPGYFLAVDVEPHLGDVDDMIECSVARELFACEEEPVLEPHEGMEFESEEAAKGFYNAYAAQMGFKARVSSFIRSKRDKTIISRQLVCSREGFRSTKDVYGEGRSKRPRMVTRVGCRAMIMVKKQDSGKWVVSKCEKLHNHVLGTQGKVVMLDYDPYVHEDEGIIENPTGIGRNLYGGMVGNSLEPVVEPPVGDPNLELHEGMEFESEEAVQVFYKEYARRVGFRARVSSYYRSKRDNSVISRLIVCSKEGFRAKKGETSEERLQRPRAVTRVGCKAMIMVKKRGSGKWVVSKLVKCHNHLLAARTASEDERSEAEDDEMIEIDKTIVGYEGDAVAEPFEGMEFESEDAAKMFYSAYCRRVGFNMRVSTYYRSKRDKSIISRLFVCSKEGFYVKKDTNSESRIKRPREATRIGCKAQLMVKKNNSGKWVVSKFEKEHNHPLGSLQKVCKLRKGTHLFGNCKVSEKQTQQYDSDRESPNLRYNNLCCEAIRYAEAGAASKDVYNVAMHALREAIKKVTSIKKNDGLSKLRAVVRGANVEQSTNQDSQVTYDSTVDQQFSTRMHLSDLLPKIDPEKPRKLRQCSACKQSSDRINRSCPEKQVNIVSSEPINRVPDEPINEMIVQGD